MTRWKGASLDLRVESASEREQPLQLKPQDRIVFSVKATDRYDLGGERHVGSSDATTLNVVRADELLAILDGRELNLRRRFEQIRSEMMQSRDSLGRLRASFRDTDGESPDAEIEASRRNAAELRDRWASWASQKSEQSGFEVDGVALAFEDIREELINNRVDTPERKSRLENQIISPLREIADPMFPEFREAIAALRALLSGDGKTAEAESKSIEVNELADKIVVAMDEVLDKMLELEDYAEIVNIVRQLIEQQDALIEKTKEEQTAGALDLFK